MKNKSAWILAGAVGAALALDAARRSRIRLARRIDWQQQVRPALDVLACPHCHGSLELILQSPEGVYHCPACDQTYPVLGGIPHFVQPAALSGWNKRFSAMYDVLSFGYRAFSKAAFAYIGMREEDARREITDRLEPGGGRVLEVSIGPGVNLPYLVGRPDMGEIFGLDLSLGQLQRCRDFVAGQGWPVQLQLGNAEQLPYLDDTFGGVFHIGGINFFNDKGKAIQEMIRVAKPGARILICDETEKGAQAYERFVPSFKKMSGAARQPILAPVSQVPPEMLELRVFDVWKGWMYCIEFRKP